MSFISLKSLRTLWDDMQDSNSQWNKKLEHFSVQLACQFINSDNDKNFLLS